MNKIEVSVYVISKHTIFFLEMYKKVNPALNLLICYHWALNSPSRNGQHMTISYLHAVRVTSWIL